MAKIPEKLPAGQLVGAEAYNALVDAVTSLSNIQVGPGLEKKSMQSGLFISMVRSPLDGRNESSNGANGGYVKDQFFAVIESASSAGANQWNYAFHEVHKPDTLGYEGNWFIRDGGASGTAYNMSEVINTTVGVQGNGVDVDTLPDGWSIQPAPAGIIVRMYRTNLSNVTGSECWFEYQNAVDGECAA